jgi:ketosteroid isomerase-like protein
MRIGNSACRKSVLRVAFILGTLALAACNVNPRPTDTRAEDEATIRLYSQAASNAAGAKDFDKLFSFYADDAIAYNNGGPTETTKEAMRADAQNSLADPGTTISWKTAAAVVARSGDLAYERGHYIYTSGGKEGKVKTQTGNYVLVWQKLSGGTWKIVSDMDTADPPIAPPAK